MSQDQKAILDISLVMKDAFVIIQTIFKIESVINLKVNFKQI